MEVVQQNRFDSSQIYQKPGIIFNADLFDPSAHKGSQKLKQNLAERFDFELLSPGVWSLLYSWYSADNHVVRFLKRDKLNKRGWRVDLYPEEKYKL